MLSIPLGSLVSSTPISTTKISPFNNSFRKPTSFPSKVSTSSNELSLLSLSLSGFCCRASEFVDLFPTVSPDNIVVREARLEDYWEVAETHCNTFFPEYSFPLDFVLRIDRLLVAMLAAMLSRLFRPSGCKRVCLVAVVIGSGISHDESVLFRSDFDGNLRINKGYVAGILTLDNFADFLPRKRPRRQRRTGIAYISNVAVRENFRRKGIAKKLIAKAESKARSWGCHAISLHCDMNNSVATMLYKGQGFKCIKVPEGAKWPQPKTSPEFRFNFMMKLLKNSASSY